MANRGERCSPYKLSIGVLIGYFIGREDDIEQVSKQQQKRKIDVCCLICVSLLRCATPVSSGSIFLAVLSGCVFLPWVSVL